MATPEPANSPLAVLTGSTASSAGTPTTPVRDGGIRGAIAFVAAAIVAGACRALDLDETETAQVMVLVPPILLILGGVWDKVVAPRLSPQ